MHVVSMHTYPVKGCHRVDHAAVAVDPWGLAGDRRWLTVDAATGAGLTQRQVRGLALIHPTPTATGLVLRTAGRPDLQVPVPSGAERVDVQIWRFPVRAAAAGAAADSWLSTVLDRDVRLVHLDDPTVRPVDPQFAESGDRVSFADGYPVLLTTTGSLDALNGWLDEPVPMTRFRPGVVVDAPAWAEDGWVGRRLRVGPVTFRAPKPCDRCVVTTIDQETGEKGREPLATLGRLRRFPQGLLFGLNLIPDRPLGTVSVGDPVEVC